MKRVLFLIAFISLVVGMASCDTNPIVTEEKGVLAMVDGASWRSGRPSAVRVSPPGRITIAAVQGGDALYLTLKPTGVGTLDLSGDDNNASFQRSEVEYQTSLPGGSGSATITKFDPDRQLISGTFSFVAVNPGNGSVTVSGGSFRDLEWAEQ